VARVSSPPVLRPLGVRDIIRTAAAVYRSHRVALWKIAAPIVALPAALGGSLAVAERQVRDQDGSSDAVAVLNVAVQFVTVVAFLLVSAATFRLVVDAYLGRPVDPDASLRFGLRNLASATWVSLLAGLVAGGGIALGGFVTWLFGLGVMPGFALFALPALYLAIAWSLAVPALLGENHRGRAALRRSRTLVSSRFWPCVGVLVLTAVLASVASVIIAVVIAVLVGTNPDDAVLFIDRGISNLISFTVVLPFEAAVTTVLYVDLRVRKDGFDGHARTPVLEPEDTVGG
jgi:hypothetical protein